MSSICYKPCPVKTGLAFSVSQNSRRGPYRAGAGVDDCTNDFLLIANGYNRFDPSKRNDRFCGNIFNSNGNVTANQPALTATASTTVCCKLIIQMKVLNLITQFTNYLQLKSNRFKFTTRPIEMS